MIKYSLMLSLVLAATTIPTQIKSENSASFWQVQREHFNELSDDACAGDGQALRDLMTAAYREDNSVAKNDLAWVYMTERCVFAEDDISEAVELQRQSAEEGYPVAQNNIANRLMKGDGIGKDPARAILYFEEAIRSNYGEAAIDFGNHLAEGIHIEQDLLGSEILLKLAIKLGADGDEIEKLQTALDRAEDGPPISATDQWSYFDGEAGWDLTNNGELVARVFLGRDYDTGGFYYGFYRVSDDPLIHFMGVSVSQSDGRITELDINGCGSRSCLTEYEGGDGIASAQVRMSISPRKQTWMLEEMKSGQDITFRYQTEASYAVNEFKRMTLSLKGSRQAIERLEAMQYNHWRSH